MRPSYLNIGVVTSSNGSIFRVTGLFYWNPSVTGGFPSQRPVTRSFDVFFGMPRQRVEQTVELAVI